MSFFLKLYRNSKTEGLVKVPKDLKNVIPSCPAMARRESFFFNALQKQSRKLSGTKPE
jgi:hypothetical protein